MNNFIKNDNFITKHFNWVARIQLIWMFPFRRNFDVFFSIVAVKSAHEKRNSADTNVVAKGKPT